MKHIKKKLLKPFKKLVTPAKSSAEFDRDSGGEYPSRDLGADKPDGADSTIAPGTNHGEGSQITNQDRMIGDQQLPTPDTSTSLTAGHDDGNANL
jgi:hypothetical protein